MEEIRYWIETEGAGHWFFIAFPLCFLCLFIWLKERRICFLIPALIISLVIINPWFYKKWDNLGYYAYWRMLWVAPVIPIIAGMTPSIIERKGKEWIKIIVVAIGIGLIVLSGSFLYNSTGGAFVEAVNEAKLSDSIVQIADRLLELKEHPKIIAQDPIGVYIRQYTGEIDTLFGRDIHGYITGWISYNAKTMNNEISSSEGNLESLRQFMLDEEYDFLVIDHNKNTDGFEFVDEIEGYGIYKAIGTPRIKKTRNELGQVTSVAYFDEYGTLVIGEKGYAKAYYKYDENGYIIQEIHEDSYGHSLADSNGSIGYQRKCDSQGHILMERTIGTEGQLVANSYGYAEVRREYKSNNLVRESYFDCNGNPVNTINLHYASITYDRDSRGNNIDEKYWDMDGKLIETVYGYAEIKRRYDAHNRIIYEAYFHADGQPFCKAAGHVAIEQMYNDDGRLSVRRYLGLDDEPLIRADGYSEARWKYNGITNVYDVLFFSDNDEKVGINGLNLAMDISGDSEHWSEWMNPTLNISNSCFYIGTVNLGDKNVGDTYTCQIEIEFKNVQATEGKEFKFWTQGATDGRWDVGNVWDGSLIYLSNPPQDGIYKYSATRMINEKMKNITCFDLGFRCDNWKSGMFRVRRVKIERGDVASNWTPGV